MKEGERLELLKRREVPVAVVRELNPVGTETFKLREAGKEREGVIRDRFAADGEVFDRGEAAQCAEICHSEGIALHVYLSHDSGGFGDLGAELFERFDISGFKATTENTEEHRGTQR